MRKRHIVLVLAFLILSVLLSFNAGRIYEAISSNGQQDVGKQNIVFSGSVFPSTPDEGTLFYHTSLEKVYVYKNGDWTSLHDSQDVSLQGPASYTVFTNGTYVFMKNETTSAVDWSASDLVAVFGACMGNLSSGGKLFVSARSSVLFYAGRNQT